MKKATQFNSYDKGGFVEPTHFGRPPRFTTIKIPTDGVDQIPALLQQGELVIPKKHVGLVTHFLRHQQINLPNMDKIPH